MPAVFLGQQLSRVQQAGNSGLTAACRTPYAGAEAAWRKHCCWTRLTWRNHHCCEELSVEDRRGSSELPEEDPLGFSSPGQQDPHLSELPLYTPEAPQLIHRGPSRGSARPAAREAQGPPYLRRSVVPAPERGRMATRAEPGTRRHNAVRLTWIRETELHLDGGNPDSPGEEGTSGRSNRGAPLGQRPEGEQLKPLPLPSPVVSRGAKVVTVQFYNETVQDHDIAAWLGRFGQVKSDARRVLDEDGVWTGARRWLVQLRPDPSAVGGVSHIPSTITLGRNRGAVFYHGMPKLCRNCGELGHLAAACTVVKCKTCGGEHETRACRDPKPCNLCGERGHLFRDCPLSYANRAKGEAPPPTPAAPPNPLESDPPPDSASQRNVDGITLPGPNTTASTSALFTTQIPSGTQDPPPPQTPPPSIISPIYENITPVKEEPESDTPITVEDPSSSDTDTDMDNTHSWNKVTRKRKGKNNTTSTIDAPSHPPNPAIIRDQKKNSKAQKILLTSTISNTTMFLQKIGLWFPLALFRNHLPLLQKIQPYRKESTLSLFLPLDIRTLAPDQKPAHKKERVLSSNSQGLGGFTGQDQQCPPLQDGTCQAGGKGELMADKVRGSSPQASSFYRSVEFLTAPWMAFWGGMEKGDSLWSGSNLARADGVDTLTQNPFIKITGSLRVHSYSIRAVHFSDHHARDRVPGLGEGGKIGGGSLENEHQSSPGPQGTTLLLEALPGVVGRRKARERRAAFDRLNAALQRLCLLQSRGLNVSQEVASTKQTLTFLHREERKKLTFRSKLQGLEEDEKCTRYFFRRARSKANNISALYNSSGVVVSEAAEVQEVARQFYEGLFSERPSDEALMDTFLGSLTRRLGEEFMEAELSTEELTQAARSMNHHKAPGPDGIPAEFYQAFWDLLKEDVAEVFRAAYREGRLGASLRQSVVSLVPKKGDLKDLRNWRPINLLSVDYKIMAKALMRRFQDLITSVIGPGPGVCHPGRSIDDNLLLVRDLIIHSGERRSPLGLLSIDQEKAFDRK
ncbi:hypothetical protein GJAV_G00184900 [Gymnothorax javanicus]|nr:hypothetical protein GJAV_G00184900 [Gymnothorax javanicus]